MAAMLLLRLYLQLTGFPQIGSGGLHIAHLLWGGLFMLLSQVVLLAVLGKRAKRWAAALGGVGFGLFIDELGKFITSDNNYFFQPAIALIYVVFVVLFLTFRAIEHRSLSANEMLVNAADMVREVVLGGETRAEWVRGRLLLDGCGFKGPLVDGVREALDGATRVPERHSRFAAAAALASRAYEWLLHWPLFHRAIQLVFVVQAVVGTIAVIGLGLDAMRNNASSVLQQGTFVSSLLSLGLVLIGVAQLPASHINAYRWFERSVLVSILFTQVILFWQSQLAALGGLLWDLSLLTVLRVSLRQEVARLMPIEPDQFL